MELKIAGGCGEHGRNCFLVENGENTFLVDCGIMAGSDDPFPRLTCEEIRRVKYLFLTHSHADHTGAIPWIYEKGFCGWIIGSSCTLKQLSFPVRNAVPLESICSGNSGKIGGIGLEYGRAGHCAGSVWYHFHAAGKSALFSGDYTEHSPVYICDIIRKRRADFAVLDCAYGNDERDFTGCCDEIISVVCQLKQQYDTLFFPVPKYGRGIELLKLLQENFPEYVCCGDELFLEQLRKIPDEQYWCKSANYAAFEYEPDCRCDILFLSDPQLRSKNARAAARRVICDGGCGVMTGTVERGSFSEKLIRDGNMELLRYPVHQNHREFMQLAEKNNFQRAIPYHSAEIPSDTFLEL
ncbi:MAG: MBL fold metallo-hydrolase [Oscillospiraceae bacterium]